MQSKTSAAPAAERYVVLDSWRGICAILVALFHFPLQWHFQGASFVRGSWLFVDFFFVLSGFVIAHAYAGKLSTRKDLVAFVIRRFGRLWPLHFALLMFVLGAAFIKYVARGMGAGIEITSNPNNTPYSFLTNFLFLHSFGLHDTVTWNTPSWSIGAEFLTNLMFGIAFLLAPWGRIPVALSLAAVGAVDLLVFSEKNIDTSAQFGLFRCMYGFFIGYVIYRVAVAEGMPSLRGQRMASVFEFACVVAIAMFAALAPGSRWQMLAPFVFAVAIWVFAAEQGVVSRLLKTPAIAIVGLLSYSIYMTHQIIIAMVNNGVQIGAKMISKNAVGSWEADFFANPWWMDAVVVVFIAAMIGAAWCTYNLIEVPWRRRFNRIASEISPKCEIVPLGVSFDALRTGLESPPVFGEPQHETAKSKAAPIAN
jgi:peptidoglycan/LPS O-acetylase OafA/YrhL